MKLEMHLLGDDIYFLAANGPTLLDLWAHAFIAEIIAPPIESPLKEASPAHPDLTDHFQCLQARLYT